ncbi:DUF4333 domain-containing protein [Pseudonocardia sp. ICBG1293]|uniref:DUF4333 domain-containing protein n=1 Tax=Pseudonocardia sp. ICBG1293 TaxID=2844382 RepID=UPI0027E156B0|nr:DUF4333 domain-containing protein [Pseudonocardia sp. ICBG1293]
MVWPGWAVTVTLDQEALQAGVRTVLIEDYQLTVTAAVQCPAGVAVLPGQRFACLTAIDGEAAEVTGVVLTVDGRYQVDWA